MINELQKKALVEGIKLRLVSENVTLDEILDSYVKLEESDKLLIKAEIEGSV